MNTNKSLEISESYFGNSAKVARHGASVMTSKDHCIKKYNSAASRKVAGSSPDEVDFFKLT
jgi:hypothetical protein